MDKILTKEQNIKKAKDLQFAMSLYTKASTLFASTKKYREEQFIETEFGLVHILCYGFNNNETTPVLFDMHGGGFVLGSAYMDEKMNIEIMKKLAYKIVSIDYVKAPDFPFPYAVNQVYSVIEHFYNNSGKYGIDKNKMAIGGHSAGGNLAAVACMKAKAEGKFQFRCQILDYPFLDAATNPYEKPQPKGCLPPEMCVLFNDCYVDSENVKNPLVSPVFAGEEILRNLPPALLILAGRDSLCNEGKRYGEKLKNAGVPVKSYEYENMKHGFTYEKSKERDDAVQKMIGFLSYYLKT